MITGAERADNQMIASGFLTNVKARIPASAYLVYCFRMPDYIRCDLDGTPLNGSNRAGLLFESLEAAKAFARDESNKTQDMGFGVYDSTWQIKATYISSAYIQKRAKAESPPRLLLWASGLIACGAALVWFDARSGWTAIFGVLIGLRLLFSGFMKLATALYRIRRNKRQAISE